MATNAFRILSLFLFISSTNGTVNKPGAFSDPAGINLPGVTKCNVGVLKFEECHSRFKSDNECDYSNDGNIHCGSTM